LELNARYLVAVGKLETNSADAFRKAWDLCQIILSTTNALPKEREQALGYAVELLPLVSKDSGTNWLRQTFQQKPEQGALLLSAVGAQVAQNSSNRDTAARRKSLEMQRKVVDALLEAAGDNSRSWQPALNVLAIGWIQEADSSKVRGGQRRP